MSEKQKILKDFKQELKEKINHLFGYFDEKGTNRVVDEVVDSLVAEIIKELKHDDLEFTADSCAYCNLVKKILGLLGIQLCSRCNGLGVIGFTNLTPLAECHKCNGTGLLTEKEIRKQK